MMSAFFLPLHHPEKKLTSKSLALLGQVIFDLFRMCDEKIINFFIKTFSNLNKVS